MRFRSFFQPFSRVLLTLSFAMLGHPVQASPLPPAPGTASGNLSQFDLLSDSSGWILLDSHLFWTSDAGQTWQEIGPSLPPDASVQAIEFKDEKRGWVLSTTTTADDSIEFQLASTTDHGANWSTRSLSLFQPGDPASYAEQAGMGWFDSQTGWISVKQSTSPNFSLGVLFTTSDGGATWTRSDLPIADRVRFQDPQLGWATGRGQLFETQDAGASWQEQEPASLAADASTVVYPPSASDRGSLLVTTQSGVVNQLNVYSRPNLAQDWALSGSLNLSMPSGRIELSKLDNANFVATVPGTKSIIRMKAGKLSVLENQDGRSGSIVALDMISETTGWAKSVQARCAPTIQTSRESISCSSVTQLLRTIDGGLSWRTLALPASPNSATWEASGRTSPLTTSTAAATDNTAAFVGQGFDICEIPTLAQMQAWWNSSPYRIINLYIGGSSRTCSNVAMTSTYLFRLSQQGWRFIPTWVGPQAPCTRFPSRMSSDVTTAATQGVSQADQAVEQLAALGLTNADKTGSVVYYDIENYGTDGACRAAVNAFMNSWVSELKARGSRAGAYGSTLCSTGLSDFQSIPNVPDVIWPARWYHNLGAGYYDPTASVWNLGSCIPNTVWADHQRVRQYEGDHNEAWGGLTLAIDSDVLDGIVSVRHDYPFVDSIVRADPDPTNAATVGFTVHFSEAVTGVNKADFNLTATGLSNASIATLSGSGSTYSVTVNTGSGNGTLRLDLSDDNTILDSASDPLGGLGAANGNYNSGEVYTVIKNPSVDTTGVFRPSNGALYMKYTNTTGVADIQINYGIPGDQPVVGDWDGDGKATIGVYRNGVFYLRNSNTIGIADLYFAFGAPGDQPIAGDWDGNGTDTIGVYRSSTGTFYLRNSNTAGAPDKTFQLGIPGDVGIAGDWNGDGLDTTGVFRPSNGFIFLKHSNDTGYADIGLNYGLPGDKPVTGDWDNDGKDTIGVYRNGKFYLRNSNTIGTADLVFNLGISGDVPIAGNWDGLP